ncbi:MAG: hypothetical protein ACREO8_07695 [Luteimonas sp.]
MFDRMPPRAAALVLVIACAACQRQSAEPTGTDAQAPRTEAATIMPQPASSVPPRSKTADDVRSHEPTSVQMPVRDTPTPAIADGAEVTYACDDGVLTVTFAAGIARVLLPGGSTAEATLSAQASAKSGGEVYVGQRLGLQRIGNAVELQQTDGATRRCVESSSSG